MNLLFNLKGRPIARDEIRKMIDEFAYKKVTRTTIRDSKALDKEVFVRCTARILSSFGMTRSGPFKGTRIAEDGDMKGKGILLKCWSEIGDDLIEIRNSVPKSGSSRNRHLLELSELERQRLTAQIWLMTKRLLPFTMGKTTHGLVAASKILFAVLPEIVLPVDTAQWLHVFKTVDLGDVISRMADDIREWENTTHHKLDEMDESGMLSTLPSVYNVMAMDARTENAWRILSCR